MIVQQFYPNYILNQIVSRYTLVTAIRTNVLLDMMVPFPPIPQQSLYFYLNDPLKILKGNGNNELLEKPKALFVGTQLSTKQLAISPNHLMFYISFYPGALHRWLKIPLSELADDDLDARLVFGSEIESLLDQMKSVICYSDIAYVVDQFIIKYLDRFKPILPIDLAIQQLLQLNGNISMELMASKACVSIRQMERQFQQRIGVAPKVYFKLIRFSKAYRMKEQNQSLTWTNIAHDSGYYDQMHLIKDFKEFTSLNPKSLEELMLLAPYQLQTHLG